MMTFDVCFDIINISEKYASTVRYGKVPAVHVGLQSYHENIQNSNIIHNIIK